MMDLDDPNHWQWHFEHRIYLDDYAHQYALVDQVDYQYLVQWRWRPHKSKARPNKTPKLYAARAVPTVIGKDVYENGKRIQQRVTSTVMLHKVVMQRKDIPLPKTNQRIIIDHANGDSLDCRRKNLRYVTLSFNNKNRFGCLEHVLDELCCIT